MVDFNNSLIVHDLRNDTWQGMKAIYFTKGDLMDLKRLRITIVMKSRGHSIALRDGERRTTM